MLCFLRHHRVSLTWLVIESHLLILLTSDHTSSPWMETARQSVLLPLYCTSSTGMGITTESLLCQQQVGESHAAAQPLCYRKVHQINCMHRKQQKCSGWIPATLVQLLCYQKVHKINCIQRKQQELSGRIPDTLRKTVYKADGGTG